MFDWESLPDNEYQIAMSVLGRRHREPDLIIAPDGNPYIYRWHLLKTKEASVYFHIQVADDPERPLHDHPWDNFSNILAGGYNEILCMSVEAPTPRNTHTWKRRAGDTIYRRAEWSHRLLMPAGVSRTLTLFSTGAKRRDWGFWYPDGWRDWRRVTSLMEDGKTSVHHAETH